MKFSIYFKDCLYLRQYNKFLYFMLLGIISLPSFFLKLIQNAIKFYASFYLYLYYLIYGISY